MPFKWAGLCDLPVWKGIPATTLESEAPLNQLIPAGVSSFGPKSGFDIFPEGHISAFVWKGIAEEDDQTMASPHKK